jgi:hypothetical protein
MLYHGQEKRINSKHGIDGRVVKLHSNNLSREGADQGYFPVAVN